MLMLVLRILDVEEEQDLLMLLEMRGHLARTSEVVRNVKFVVLLCPFDKAVEVLVLQVLLQRFHIQAAAVVEVVVVEQERSS